MNELTKKGKKKKKRGENKRNGERERKGESPRKYIQFIYFYMNFDQTREIHHLLFISSLPNKVLV